MTERAAAPGPEAAEAAVRDLLAWIGEDPGRPGLAATPERVAAGLREMVQGYAVDPEALLRNGSFESADHQLVVVRDLAFHSLCEHHLLPFYGAVHIAYVPGGRLVGLSKLARAVDAVSQRLQVQERMTAEIVHALDAALAPEGAMVAVEAQHLCMAMRGARKPGHLVWTRSVAGVFPDPGTRAEAVNLLGGAPA